VELIPSERYFGNFKTINRSINYENIQGSPYLDEELIQGYVKFSLGDSNVYFLRYNIYADEMEYLDGSSLKIISNPSELDHVHVNKHSFYYTTYKFRNSFKEGYLEKLVDGTVELYLKYDVDFKKYEEAKSSYHEAKPERFETGQPTWYASVENGPIKNFEVNKSGLESIFQDDYAEVQKYIKSNKLKLRKEEDVIKLFEHYNSSK
jgi:hypothetical protein